MSDYKPSTWTSTLTSSASSEAVTTVVTTAELVLDVVCPDCGGVAEAWPGNSTGWWTGVRELYTTYTVRCQQCGRTGFPAYYQEEKNRPTALRYAILNFLNHDSRPTLEVSSIK